MGKHRESALRVSRPFLWWPIPVKLHAVLIGITQIQRFADAMVRGAIERNARARYAPERIGELAPCRIQDRKMIKAGRLGWRGTSPEAFPRIQSDVMMIPARGKKRRRVAITLRHFKPED